MNERYVLTLSCEDRPGLVAAVAGSLVTDRATAHYMTSALDEGPIIAHDVEQIIRADTPDDLIRTGYRASRAGAGCGISSPRPCAAERREDHRFQT